MLQLPNITVQLNQILPENGKKLYTKKLPEISFILSKEVQIAPQLQVLLERSLAKFSGQYQSCTGLVTPSDRLEDKCSFALTSSLREIDDKRKVFVSAKDLSDYQNTLNIQTGRSRFDILNEAQADDLIEFDPQLNSLAKMPNQDVFEGEQNQLTQGFHFKKVDTTTSRPPPDYPRLWFRTPETCIDFSTLRPLRISEEKVVIKFCNLSEKKKWILKILEPKNWNF